MLRGHLIVVAGAGAVLAGCAPIEPVEITPAPARPQAAARPSPAAALEASTLSRAKRYAREGHPADALVQWELLSLLEPDNDEYRGAIQRTRVEIRNQAAHLLTLAEQAHRRGNTRQATEYYLRVLSIDRTNARAAQALRDMESERTRRAYFNRPPRMSMPE